jgi:hypothetical protein
MENLYTITQNFSELLDFYNQATEENNQEQIDLIEQALAINNENFKEKANNYVRFIRSQELESKMIDEEIKRLTELKKSKESKALNLKERLSNSMQTIGLDKYDLDLFKLSFRKSESVDIQDIEILSDDFKRVKTVIEADKLAIKTAIKSGQEVLGAIIKESRSLQIK